MAFEMQTRTWRAIAARGKSLRTMASQTASAMELGRVARGESPLSQQNRRTHTEILVTLDERLRNARNYETELSALPDTLIKSFSKDCAIAITAESASQDDGPTVATLLYFDTTDLVEDDGGFQ
jgi:hypothetical protein